MTITIRVRREQWQQLVEQPAEPEQPTLFDIEE